MNPRAPIFTLGLVLSLALPFAAGCKPNPRRGPEQLREAYLDALEANDPDAAYELLAPDVQARVSREEFRARWESQADERAKLIEQGRSVETDPIMSGTTAHPGGRVVRWVEVDGQFVIASGLPGIPDVSTPDATVRALIAALRARDEHALVGLVEEELLAETREELEIRLEAMEDALTSPGAFDYTPDMMRAVLRYARGRSIVLERGEDDLWKIVAIE